MSLMTISEDNSFSSEVPLSKNFVCLSRWTTYLLASWRLRTPARLILKLSGFAAFLDISPSRNDTPSSYYWQ